MFRVFYAAPLKCEVFNMLALKILFIVLATISLVCIIIGAVNKRRNIGYLLTGSLVIFADIIAFLVIGVDNAAEASKVLIPYYLIHSWVCTAFFFMIINTLLNKRVRILMIPMILISLYQDYIIILQMKGERILQFQKRIFFRTGFWVAIQDSKNDGLLNSFRSYRIGQYLSITICIVFLIICIIRVNKLFRFRYFIFEAIAGTYILFEALRIIYSIPEWMPILVYNLASGICLYYVTAYVPSRIRNWSLDSFANDMSDGLILYDNYNDLIHINNMIRETLDEALVSSFSDKTKLEQWIKANTEADFTDVITYKQSGKEYFFRVKTRELGDARTHIGTLYILHDNTNTVTRIRAMEKANAELERASRMKSDFLANMSHEIRTPMNAVIGMAEIAMHEKDPSKQLDSLLQIQKSGKNLLNIINDILDYSKIESGKMELIEDDYVPFEEFSDIANMMITRIGDKDLEFYFLVEGPLPHKLHADAMRIRQVIINLAGNAIKFTHEGAVAIEVKCTPLSNEMIDMMYHVKDTGIGIREEDLDKLFVSFQQVDSKRNRSVEGTGLGLAISQKLVQAMGGEIGVESEYGKGSDFWFHIPVRVVDNTNDMAIEKADEKYCFGINEKKILVDNFEKEMDNLGIECTVSASLGSYIPTGKKEYFFIEEYYYTYSVKDFFASHPDAECMVLIKPGSGFTPDRPNVHIMDRPNTTMKMVNIFNNRFGETGSFDEDKIFSADFTAPSAQILVVDDNDINLSIAEGLMSPLKVKVDKADGGRKAIEMAAAKDYDIIFMDHMMPEVDGVDATKAIRKNGTDPRKPVIIALSANAMEEARKLFAESGMNDFVAKPIDVRILTSKIKEWLPSEKIIEGIPAEQGTAVPEPSAIVSLSMEELDTETAVRALGSPELYDKIAGEYFRCGEEKLASIKQAFDSEDWENYTIRVHALKSSSRQIGAMDLGSKAEALEKAGKAGDTDKIKADTDALLSDYKALLDKMSSFYEKPEEEASDKPPIDEDTLDKILEDIESACEDLDFDVLEEATGQLNEYSYEGAMKEGIDELAEAVGSMDTDACLEAVRKIRSAR